MPGAQQFSSTEKSHKRHQWSRSHLRNYSMNFSPLILHGQLRSPHCLFLSLHLLQLQSSSIQKLSHNLALGCAITGLCPETEARPNPPPTLPLPDSPFSCGLRLLGTRPEGPYGLIQPYIPTTNYTKNVLMCNSFILHKQAD